MRPTVKSLQNQVSLLDQNWKRALADYQNLVKRVEADKKDFIRFAAANIFSKLIPSLDVLQLAAKHNPDPGLQMAVKQFADALSSEGLQEIVPAPGTPFDHTRHECLETVPGDPPGSISETVLKGYCLGDLVIRPAKVKVYQSATST